MTDTEFQEFLLECDETQQRISALCNPNWSWAELPEVAIPWKTKDIGRCAWNYFVATGRYTTIRLLVDLFHRAFIAGDSGELSFKSEMHPLDLEILSLQRFIVDGKDEHILTVDGSTIALNGSLFY